MFLTCKEYLGISCAYNLGEAYSQEGSLIDLCQYKGKFTGKRFIDDFDYVSFLSKEFKF